MNSTFVPAGLVLAVIGVSGCAATISGQNSASDQALRKMSTERLRAVLDGNTVKWPDGSAVYYTGSEIRTLGLDGESIIGAIDFNNDRHCRSWDGGGERCSTVYEGVDGRLSFFVEGEADSSTGYALIVNGNPNKL